MNKCGVWSDKPSQMNSPSNIRSIRFIGILSSLANCIFSSWSVWPSMQAIVTTWPLGMSTNFTATQTTSQPLPLRQELITQHKKRNKLFLCTLKKFLKKVWSWNCGQILINVTQTHCFFSPEIYIPSQNVSPARASIPHVASPTKCQHKTSRIITFKR